MRIDKRKYVPDLSDLQAVCEVNYARITTLLSDVDVENLTYQLRLSSTLCYQLRLVDAGRYTSTLEVTQQHSHDDRVKQPDMVVRLYHDARMAEVTQCAQITRFEPRYHYPNQRMHHPDEKHMLNRFLGEWLSFCLQQKPRLASTMS